MLKKTTFAVLGLVFCGAASAGMYSTPPAPTCTPGDVTVPCEATKWDVGIQALYLQPLYSSGLTYVTLGDNNYHNVDADWGWGYRLQGSYHYNTGSDITINWSHYDVDGLLGRFNGSYIQLTPAPVAIPAQYNLYLDNQYDQVNLVFGQHVDMGLVKNARFYTGLQYARIQVEANRIFEVPAIFSAATRGGARRVGSADFNGMGPVIGIDYSYDLSHGLSLTANTAASLLYGSARVSVATSYNNGLVVASEYGSTKKMTTGLEAKLGANYAYEMAQGVLNLEGGYQTVNYFNVLNTGLLSGTTNFGLYGPYFGVKWLGNA
ncbi:Lpg1974 family pore-forming outer membrane protein [Legionella sp. CNM-4043-24]|uniref:Lpg1974 family pore-forming outer membrane protein n=1 Tax=Legionella sp. CNM-4043-24 TaxID=3421646 RepID=UPI00403B2398